MTIHEKVANAVARKNLSSMPRVQTAKDYIEAFKREVWTKFDPEDPNTWPSGFAPSGLNWLVRRDSPSFMETSFVNLLPYFNNTHSKWIAMHVTHYADPIDFLPSSLSVNKNEM